MLPPMRLANLPGRHRIAVHGGEVGARLGDAGGEAPAVVHRRQHQELVGVELEEVREHAQHRIAGIERRIGEARLEVVEDDAGVLPGLVAIGDDDRDEREAGARHDDVAVGLRRRQELHVRHALVAQRRPHLGGEVGDVGAVEAVEVLAVDRHPATTSQTIVESGVRPRISIGWRLVDVADEAVVERVADELLQARRELRRDLARDAELLVLLLADVAGAVVHRHADAAPAGAVRAAAVPEAAVVDQDAALRHLGRHALVLAEVVGHSGRACASPARCASRRCRR